MTRPAGASAARLTVEEIGLRSTRIRALDDEERIDEIARMLGGVKITRQTREHAREMIGQAQSGGKSGRKKAKTKRA